MDNAMDNCPKCGASYALVGRVHNCRPRLGARLIQAAKEGREIIASPTYKYRDPVKRRAQVAAAMRAYRGRLKSNVPAN